MSTSTRARVANESGKRSPPALAIGMFSTEAGAPAALTDIVGVKTCVFVTAATVIAPGAVPGDGVLSFDPVCLKFHGVNSMFCCAAVPVEVF